MCFWVVCHYIIPDQAQKVLFDQVATAQNFTIKNLPPKNECDQELILL